MTNHLPKGSEVDPLKRIVADNDPRNGSFLTRLFRTLEHPEMQPDADGLYPAAQLQTDNPAMREAK